MQQQALSAIVAWVRLDAAIQSFNQALRRDFGITGLQLAVLRILGERPALPLAALRKSLVMHPATLGQSIDELRVMDLATVTRDPRDKRARIVAITDKGRELMSRAPLAGPVRLREFETDPARLDALKAAFDDSVELFGLADYLPKKNGGTLMAEIEETPNIGKVLGKRLRHVGIDTREKLEKMGAADAFLRLCAEYPEDACVHTRLALAGAVRGIRWHDLPQEVQSQVTRGLHR